MIALAYIPVIFVAGLVFSGGAYLLYFFAPLYALLYVLPVILGLAVVVYVVVEALGQVLNRLSLLTPLKHLAAGGVVALALGCIPSHIQQRAIDPRDLLLEDYAAAAVFYALVVYVAIGLWWLSYVSRRTRSEKPRATLAATVLSVALISSPLLLYGMAQTSRLHDAIRTGPVDAVATAYKPWKSLDGRDRKGNTPLDHAIIGNKLDVAKFLLERGASVQFKTRSGEKVDHLERAVSYRRPEFVDLFLSRPDQWDGRSAIKTAVDRRDMHILQRLLEKGMRPPGQALHAAVQKGDVELAEVLLAHGAKLAGAEGQAAFSAALYAGKSNAQMLELLLRSGYPVRERTDQGQTQLFYAARAKRVEAVRLLLRYGADANDRGKECRLGEVCFGSRTALHEAASFNSTDGRSSMASAEIVALLLKHGAKPNVVDEGGNTPLYAAAYTGNLAAAEHLLKAGANPNIGRPDRRIGPLARTQVGFEDLLRKFGFEE